MSNDPSLVPVNTEQFREESNSDYSGINTLSFSGSTKPCPKPEADFQLISQNPDIFLQKLQAFHASLGTKFKIPTVGGKRLDLHHLFLEVTSRGGIEKVIRDRRWKEVTGTFKFPSSITSASFVLRKYYLSLLYHFEQVYYLRKELPSVSPADATIQISNESAAQAPWHGCSPVGQHLGSSDLEDGSSVVGTIDAKFDYGYIITVNLGSETLRGVLYHTPTKSSMSLTPNILTSSAKGKRKKRHLKFKDPSRPKRNSSGYNFFFAEHYARLKPSHQGRERLISKKIGILWNRLSEAEKQVYQERGVRDKERYKMEMLEYKSSHH